MKTHRQAGVDTLSETANQGGQRQHTESNWFEKSNEWLKGLLGMDDGKDVRADPGITDQDLIYEQMAHRMIYQKELHPEDRQLLESWGYEPDWDFLDGAEGMQAARFPPAPGSGRKPVLVFRGTEPTEKEDLAADLAPVIGQTQFDANQEALRELMGKDASYDITGHSLGASLAQLAALDDPKRVDNLVGFQAPGVSKAQADAFSELEDRPEVRYHLAKQDLVDLGGEAHLEGEFFVHNARQHNLALDAHTGYLLLSPQYADLRKDLGLDDGMLDTLDTRNEGMFGVAHNTDKLTERHQSVHHEAYPRGEAKSLVEHLRQGLGRKVDWAHDHFD